MKAKIVLIVLLAVATSSHCESPEQPSKHANLDKLSTRDAVSRVQTEQLGSSVAKVISTEFKPASEDDLETAQQFFGGFGGGWGWGGGYGRGFYGGRRFYGGHHRHGYGYGRGWGWGR